MSEAYTEQNTVLAPTEPAAPKDRYMANKSNGWCPFVGLWGPESEEESCQPGDQQRLQVGDDAGAQPADGQRCL